MDELIELIKKIDLLLKDCESDTLFSAGHMLGLKVARATAEMILNRELDMWAEHMDNEAERIGNVKELC